MKTRVKKWGNSLGVRLPKSIAEQQSLTEGTGVTVAVKNNVIVIEATADEQTLDTLLNDMSLDSVHTETEWFEPRGNEVW